MLSSWAADVPFAPWCFGHLIMSSFFCLWSRSLCQAACDIEICIQKIRCKQFQVDCSSRRRHFNQVCSIIIWNDLSSVMFEARLYLKLNCSLREEHKRFYIKRMFNWCNLINLLSLWLNTFAVLTEDGMSVMIYLTYDYM